MNNKLYLRRRRQLVRFYREKERMPSYDEMADLFNVHSKGSLHKYVKTFAKEGLVGKTETGRLIPTVKLYGLRVLGTVQAGFPTEAEEEQAGTMSMDEFLIQHPESCYMLTVSGDSMIEAGIVQGDLVIVDRSITPKNGDIVVAEVDHEWTMKYLIKMRDKTYLHPANKKYPDIFPKNELRIAGVVTSVVRKYR